MDNYAVLVLPWYC